jgi:hypothetical protein
MANQFHSALFAGQVPCGCVQGVVISWWLMIDDWWLMIDDWWLMIDDWWLMIDDWWLMIDDWWLMMDDWWLMIDVWWLMIDDWWLMIDDWWLMIDDWWLMIDDWWLMMDDWWLMIDDWWLMIDDWWLMIDDSRLMSHDWWLISDDVHGFMDSWIHGFMIDNYHCGHQSLHHRTHDCTLTCTGPPPAVPCEDGNPEAQEKQPTAGWRHTQNRNVWPLRACRRGRWWVECYFSSWSKQKANSNHHISSENQFFGWPKRFPGKHENGLLICQESKVFLTDCERFAVKNLHSQKFSWPIASDLQSKTCILE